MTKPVSTPLFRIAFLAIAALFIFSSVAAHAATATVTPGKKVTLSVAANGTSPFAYQWKKDGVNISGAIASTYVVQSVQVQDAGNYTVAVSNAAGATTSDIGTLIVQYAPSFLSLPRTQYVTVGANVTFSASASALPAPTYQWQKNGSPIVGATSSTYTVSNAQLGDAASYSVVATNSLGSTLSSSASLSVVTAPTTPVRRDFNSDGQVDIIWRNSVSGDVALWLMNGTAFQSGTVISNVDIDWTLAGTNDFNGDGQTDLLWRNNSTGEVSFWLMNGTAPQSVVSMGIVPQVWQISGTGDFNSDGKPDILWRNTYDGNVALWVMNGVNFQQGFIFTNVPMVWQISGTGDFNGDGKTDILWRNTYDGNVALWVMDNTNFQQGYIFDKVPMVWQISGTGDFNSDGQIDIIWRNTVSGDVALWLMQGTTFQQGFIFNTIPLVWQIGS